MDKYIIDTNIFFNMESGLGLGGKTVEVMQAFTKAAKVLKAEKRAEFLLPPRIVEEIYSFFDNHQNNVLHNFLSQITIQSPDYGKICFPAFVFQQLVEETRTRAYRGLTVAEDEIKKAAELFNGKEVAGKKEFELTIGPIIRNFRERYRHATRNGFIDSAADLDLLVLAKEIGGCLISTDEGVIRWGRILGVKEMTLPAFGQILQLALKK